jgi:oxygen-independent coproporphyrinogen-3 oxidase
MPMSGDLGIYVHIPFCTKKCPYCHFFVLLDKSPSLHDQLLEGLIAEWRLLKPAGKIATIYFGGGTPSLFGPERVEALLKEIGGDPVEVTLEVNPEKATVDLMRDYLNSGINRISLGVQSFDDPLLQKIGRTHDSGKALHAIEAIALAGFGNVTIDLMYDLPGQSLKAWEETLTIAASLPITHISLYNLQIEPKTLFFKTKPKQPSQEESLAMYEMAFEILTANGFYQYEISAFAKPNFEANHNSRYIRSEPFFGLGPSAFSDFEGERRQNGCHLGRDL